MLYDFNAAGDAARDSRAAAAKTNSFGKRWAAGSGILGEGRKGSDRTSLGHPSAGQMKGKGGGGGMRR